MMEQWLAGLGLVACAVVALGIWVGPAWRERNWKWLRSLPRQRAQRRQTRQAEAEAAAAIERARRARPEVERKGNVYRPKSFKDDRSADDKLH